MSQSLDGSSRDIINSIDSANKITAKKMIKTTMQSDATKLKINRLDESSIGNSLNQSQLTLNRKIINIETEKGTNVIQEKNKTQIILESLGYALFNFSLIYYLILLILDIYYEVSGAYIHLYICLSMLLCFLISFIDTYLNKLQLFSTLIYADQTQVLTFINDSFQSTKVCELIPGNLIKLQNQQKCPGDGLLIGSSGSYETIKLTEVSGQIIQRRVSITDFSIGKSLEGFIELDEENKKAYVQLKVDVNHFNMELLSQHKIKILQENTSKDDLFVLITGNTIREQRPKNVSAYEKTKLDPKLGFSIHIQILLLVLLNILIGIILLTLNALQDTNQYLDDKISYNKMKIFIQIQATLCLGIPIMQQPYISIINRITKYMAEKDRLLDPKLSGSQIEIINSNALANMARAKYIMTDLQLLSRQTLRVNNFFLNKQSEEINLNNLITITAIEDIDDNTFCQQEIRYALLSFLIKNKTQADIAIQQKILDYGLFLGINGNQRIVQDLEQNQQYYKQLFELVQQNYTIMGYEQILKEDVKQYIIVYRATLKDCKDFLDQNLQLQLRDYVDVSDNLNELIIIFKKIVSLQYINKLATIIKQKNNIDIETLKQIKLEIEPTLFIELDNDFYDCSSEIIDLKQCEYKIWINSHIKDPSILEADPTISELYKNFNTSVMICQHSDELQVALDQLEMNCQIKQTDKINSYQFNEKPLLLIIDDSTLQIGLKNELIKEKFINVFLKVPLALLINAKPNMVYTLMQIVQAHEVISVSNYIQTTSSIQINVSQTQQTAYDIKLPNFSFLPKLILVHGRLNNIRQNFSIKFINYTSFMFLFLQTAYICYNKFSSQYFYNEFIYFILGLFTIGYGIAHLMMAQDFNFDILQNHPVYHMMVRVSKNPYKILLLQGLHGLIHACFIIFGIIYSFYGSNDQNGYVHGFQLQQYLSLCIFCVTIAFKPILEQYKIVKFQIYAAILYILSVLLIIYYQDGYMQYLFETGIKTKDLCSMVFFPICALTPNLISKLSQRLLSAQQLYLSLQKMDNQSDQKFENQRLRDAKNYIRLYQKEEVQEQQEDVGASKKNL